MHWGYYSSSSSRTRDVPAGSDGISSSFDLPRTLKTDKLVSSEVVLNLMRRTSSRHSDQYQYDIDTDSQTVGVNGEQFTFDSILMDASKDSSSNGTATSEIVQDLMDGYNFNITSYGQSKTGKTQGLFDLQTGVVPNVCHELYTRLERNHTDRDTEFTITLSIFELFAETVFDLLIPITSRKPLKLYHPTENDLSDIEKNDYSIKNLKCIPITSEQEFIDSINEVTSTYHESRKSHVFIRINIHQLNHQKDLIKNNFLQIIDLKDIESLSKHDVSHEELKKIKLGLNSFENIIERLSLGKKITTQLKNSNLTRLMYSSFLNNYKNCFLICASSLQEDKLRTLQTLKFSQKLKLIEFPIHKNHHGLNPKKKIDLYIEDMKAKEDNYISKIKLLSASLQSLKDSQDQINNKVQTNFQRSQEENKSLKEQLRVLESLTDFGSTISIDINDKDKIMDELLRKCDQVAQLQLSLDDEKHKNYTLKENLKHLEGNATALDNMNDKLLKQVNIQEESLRNVLSHNAILENEIMNWNYVVNHQVEKLKLIEERLKETNKNKIGVQSIKDTSIPETSDTIELKQGPDGKNPLAGSRRSSAVSSNDFSLSARINKKGLRLNSFRIVSNPIVNDHTGN